MSNVIKLADYRHQAFCWKCGTKKVLLCTKYESGKDGWRKVVGHCGSCWSVLDQLLPPPGYKDPFKVRKK